MYSLGLGVRNGSHSARSRPLLEQSECIERPCEATSAEGTARCASRGMFYFLGYDSPEQMKQQQQQQEQQNKEMVHHLMGSAGTELSQNATEYASVPEVFLKKG